jgi:hypothetical protein
VPVVSAVVERLRRENGFGVLTLADGTQLTFDVSCLRGAFLPADGSRVRVVLTKNAAGEPNVAQVRPFPSLDQVTTLLTPYDVETVLEVAEGELREHGPSGSLWSKLAEVRTVLGLMSGDTSGAAKHLASLLARLPGGLLDPGEPFAAGVVAELRAMSDAERQPFDALIAHAATATSSKPSAKWLVSARARVQSIGDERLASAFARWFPLVQKLPTAPEWDPYRGSYEAPLSERTSDVLRGLVWIASFLPTPEMASVVGDLAATCFKKVPNIGALSNKVGNACLWTLGEMSSSGIHGVAQLGRLKTRVKLAQALRLIDKALSDAAARAGLSMNELLELGVPTCGLDANGVFERQLGEFTARIGLDGHGGVVLSWIRNDGKVQASVPADVKQSHAEDLEAIKVQVRDIATLLPAQALRIETMMMEPRDIRIDALRERYIDHGLVGRAARRLIWSLGTNDEGAWTSGIFDGERFVDHRGQTITMDRVTRARLWHPLGRPPVEVLAWRRFIAQRGITQPFKQAHREIYVVTDAELQTETYSNRFAAHVLKQHQLAALCRDRGWRYTLQGRWDSANAPHRRLPLVGLTIEFFVEAAWETDAITDAGVFLHVSTDQVRFTNDDGEPVPLRDVPALVFSETMRDVDLFVGVASVGNDPNWRDGGPQAGHGYWQAFAFGELTASAVMRREVLGELIPKLKAKERLSLDGRFLVVRGDLRTYKIHLGSGNILMEPNDQYLCIVPDRGGHTGTESLVLPFEGDGGLSVILSKALLLAADTKIEDETILRQIRMD